MKRVLGALRGRRTHFGVAIGADTVTVVPLGRGSATSAARHTISPFGDSDDEWEDLRHALESIRGDHGAAAPVAHVVLLPPLAAVRRVQLPRLRDAERRQLLARDVARHVPGARAARVLASTWHRERGNAQGRTFLADTAARVHQAVGRALRDAGWKVAGVAPAQLAWYEGARAIWPALRAGSGWVVVAGQQGDVLLELRTGLLASIRRLPPSRSTADGLATIIDLADGKGTEMPASPIAFVGSAGRRADLGHALRARGANVLDATEETADSLAARFAHAVSRLELVDDEEHARRATRSRRVTVALCAASVLALMSAAGMELWGVRRELAAVRAERAAISNAVGRAMAARAGLDSTTGLLAALAEREATAPRWSGLIAELADRLPIDASLTSFHARGDTVVMDGAAGQAAGVFESLQDVLRLTGARPDAPIRRELDAAGQPMERFTATARTTERAMASPNAIAPSRAGGSQ